MCLEKVPPSSSSKYKQAEWEEQRVQCFELAGDLTLLYLQEQDKIQQTTYTNTGSYSPQPPHPERQIGPVLETALQRAPILYIQGGKLQSAVARYRTMLSAVEFERHPESSSYSHQTVGRSVVTRSQRDFIHCA
ncbi:unnamed protein product [Timema podura]|uniref:Tetratricopeptide repeat protein 7 N-terminal domain-containing protein n=1 Tax=Timema podura TaxID=61482 RepID=A0ABN7NTZ4_TIMPD|nr:unnamed protein product [Timema podura]